MKPRWIAFSYTLSAKKKSSTRVSLWRRLRRLGSISPTGGIYILPADDDCIESFQWLAQEVKQAEGQAVVMHVDGFDGLEDQAIIEMFQEARQADYAEINEQAATLENLLKSEPSVEEMAQIQDELVKLKRKHAETGRIDYFDSYESLTTAARLEKIGHMLFPETNLAPEIPVVQIADYQGKRWVTRPQPHVDRLACIWLIRRFIDPHTTIIYSSTFGADDIAFDMSASGAHDAAFGHNGNLCTFETMVKAFQIEAMCEITDEAEGKARNEVKGINTLAEIVHEIDLRDQRFVHPEAIGIDAILRGWLAENLDDAELEKRGVALFNGLFQTLSTRP